MGESSRMSAIARIAVSPRLSLAALRSIRPATVQASSLLSTSAPKSDIDSAAKFIGAGAATVGGWVRCWNRLRLRLAHHRLRQEPWSQAAAVLLRHPGIRPLRGYGAFLSHDGLPPPLCLLRRWRKSWTPLYIIVARSF